MFEKTTSILSQLEGAGVPMERQTQLLSLALAKTLAFACPLVQAEEPTVAYKGQFEGKVQQVLAQINEKVVIDIDLINAQVLELWTLRYQLAFNPTHKVASDFFDCVGAKLGIQAVTTLSEYEGAQLQAIARQIASSVAPEFVQSAEAAAVTAEPAATSATSDDVEAPVEGQAPQEG